MSRIGKQPVAIPEKVDLKINNGVVEVKGPKGQLAYTLTDKRKCFN
jgi:large subunit ribosomal protein L6